MGGLASALLAGTLLALLLPTAVGVGLGLSIYAVAAGALLPLAVAEGLDAVPAQAGRAASILGAVQLTVGAGASSLVESGLDFGAVALAAAALTALSAWAGVILSFCQSLRLAALAEVGCRFGWTPRSERVRRSELGGDVRSDGCPHRRVLEGLAPPERF